MTKYKHTIISFSLISWNNPSPQKIRKTKDNRIRTYTEPAILIDETFQFSHAVSIKIIINWLAACKDVSFGYCSGTGESVTKQKTARGDGKREREREREREKEREEDGWIRRLSVVRSTREGAKGDQARKRGTEPFTKRFFAPYFLTRTSNRKHTSDILRRLVDVERTSSDLLIPTTILTAFVRWSLPGGDDWGRRWQGCERLCTPPTCIAFALSLSLSLFLYIWLHLCLPFSPCSSVCARNKGGEEEKKKGG